MLSTKTARYLTIVELLTVKQYWDDAQGCPARDFLNVERRSDYPLSKTAIDKIAAQYPGYMVSGITEIDTQDGYPDEF